MKKTLFALVACLVFCSGMEACPKKDTDIRGQKKKDKADAAELTRPVTDPRYGVTIMLPAEWEIKVKKENPVLFAMAPDAGPDGPMVNVVVEDINRRLSPFDYLEANILTMQVSLKDLEIVKSGVEPVSETSTAWIHYTYPRRDEQVEALSYSQTREYKAYVVTCIAPDKKFEEHRPTFRAIGRSLRIED